jgi:hypothetical protein
MCFVVVALLFNSFPLLLNVFHRFSCSPMFFNVFQDVFLVSHCFHVFLLLLIVLPSLLLFFMGFHCFSWVFIEFHCALYFCLESFRYFVWSRLMCFGVVSKNSSQTNKEFYIYFEWSYLCWSRFPNDSKTNRNATAILSQFAFVFQTSPRQALLRWPAQRPAPRSQRPVNSPMRS